MGVAGVVRGRGGGGATARVGCAGPAAAGHAGAAVGDGGVVRAGVVRAGGANAGSEGREEVAGRCVVGREGVPCSLTLFSLSLTRPLSVCPSLSHFFSVSLSLFTHTHTHTCIHT